MNNILLVYPEFPDTFWSFKHALGFVGKKASSPPLGLVTVAAMLPAEWNKRLVDLNITSLTKKDLQWADYVYISAMTVQRQSVYEVIKQCNQVGVKIVAGGPLFTGEYEQFPGVDHFILNEAELTLPSFLDDLQNNTAQHTYKTDEYADITQTPIPIWELVDIHKYDSLSIQFSRGCPFNCDFCNITAMLGHIPRIKTVSQIIAELDKMYALGWRRNIFFVDDNFIGNKKFLKQELLPALIAWRMDKSGCLFITEASINLADDPELMALMVKAGFKSVFVGIETPDEESLTECHKSQNKNRNLIESVRRLHQAGLQVMGGFIVGFDSDTTAIFQRQIDFIQKSGIVTAMVGLLQAPYGTQLYDRMKSEGRLNEEMSGDNADGNTNIVPKMDIQVLKTGYRQILDNIYSPRLFYERVRQCLSDYEPAVAPVHLEFQEILAFFRSIYRIGILGPERYYFWQLLLWTIFTDIRKFPQAVTFAIYGFHFRKVSELTAAVPV